MVINNAVVPIKLPIMWLCEFSWGKLQFLLVLCISLNNVSCYDD